MVSADVIVAEGDETASAPGRARFVPDHRASTGSPVDRRGSATGHAWHMGGEVIGFSTAAIGLGTSAICGLLAGFIPAWRARRTTIIQAVRR